MANDSETSPNKHSVWVNLQRNLNESILDSAGKGHNKWDRHHAVVNILVGEMIFDDDGNDISFTSKPKLHERLKFVLPLLARAIVTDHGKEGEMLVELRIVTDETPEVVTLRSQMAAMLTAKA
jgi:hypothetical protein